MSLSVSAPRPQRQSARATNPAVAAARIVGLLAGTFGAIGGGLWYSSKSTCATAICRLDAPAVVLSSPVPAQKSSRVDAPRQRSSSPR